MKKREFKHFSLLSLQIFLVVLLFTQLAASLEVNPKSVKPIDPKIMHNLKEQFKTKLYYQGSPNKKLVALTIDDGPDPIFTARVLTTLKYYNAKATFFVVGKRVEMYPEITKLIQEDGHEIANHTYSHPNLNKLTKEQIIEELRKNKEIIVKLTGTAPTLVRPPGGEATAPVLSTIIQEGYTVALWDVNPGDWSMPGVEKIVSNVMKSAKNGSIILMHNGGIYNHGGLQTLDALPLIIDGLQKKGFKLVTVSELIKETEN